MVVPGNDTRRNSSTTRSLRNSASVNASASSLSLMASANKSHHAATARPAPTHPTESHTILFEWPVTGLKNIFDSSKTDGKSKQIKSAPFGDGRWTVLFYAHKPLQSERIQPFLGPSTASDPPADPGWERQGVFRFTFTIQTIDKSAVLATKEAHDHAFSHKTSNWGWAQFIKRDAVYYSNNAVKQTDSFLITVSIQASPSKPNPAPPVGVTVSPVLVQAYGSLLDDPEHSDVVFHLVTPRHVGTGTKRRSTRKTHRTRHIYAIKKILAATSEYFRDMFEGGFSEGEQNDDQDDEDEDGSDAEDGEGEGEGEGADDEGQSDADARDVNMDGSAPAARRASTASRTAYTEDDSESGQEHEPLLHDSDAEIDGAEGVTEEASATGATGPPTNRHDGRKRRKVVVRDSSYATFKALLFYLYTGTIDFAPLTSSFIDARTMGESWGSGTGGRRARAMASKAASTGGATTQTTMQDFNAAMLKAHARRQEGIALYRKRHPDRPSPCSAKAMYRLADKLQIPDLKKLAQDHLRSSLTVYNIVWEAFSSFTSQFAEVRRMEVQFLLRHWPAVKKTQAMKNIFLRAHAHPGLAEVWPHLLSQLDYRHVASGPAGTAAGGRGAAAAAAAAADMEEYDLYDDDEEDDDDMMGLAGGGGGAGAGGGSGGAGAGAGLPPDDEDDEDGDGLLFNAEN